MKCPKCSDRCFINPGPYPGYKGYECDACGYRPTDEEAKEHFGESVAHYDLYKIVKENKNEI